MTEVITITHKFNEAFSLKIFGKRLEKEHATGKSSEPRSSKYIENFGTEVRNKYCKKEKVLFAGNADHHEVGIVEKNLGAAFPKGSTRTELKIKYTIAVSPRCV